MVSMSQRASLTVGTTLLVHFDFLLGISSVFVSNSLVVPIVAVIKRPKAADKCPKNMHELDSFKLHFNYEFS